MSIPSNQQLMRPVLEELGERGVLRFRTLVGLIADRIRLGEEERAQTLDGGETVISNRVGWTLTYLVQSGAARRPRHGFAEITDRGRQLLREVDGPIGNRHLAQFEEFQAFKRRAHSPKEARAVSAVGLVARSGRPEAADDKEQSPREVIEAAAKDHRAALTGELLNRVMQLSPTAYERLVLRLLEAMGYGASGRIESTAKTGDAGIDGVISQDPLGLDRIYVQAKRYARDRTVGRPLMQEFVGALHGQQADRGVFMTTCSFTRDALEYAGRVGARIIPVDGDEMAALLLRNGVGVQPDYTAVLHRIDEDFFETLEG